MGENLEVIQELVMLYGIKILMALLIFVIGKWVVKKIAKVVEKLMSKNDVDPAIQNFAGSLVYWALLIFVSIAALGQLGIQTASFVAIVGAAGLAIGLALQGSLANFAAGVLILIFRPFKVGDFIEIAGVSGVVQNIQIFTTELNSPDNKKIIVPNGGVISGNIVNYSANDTRRVDLVFGVGYGDDIDAAKAVLAKVVANNAQVLEFPETTIAVVELADSSVNLVCRPWVKTADYWGAYFEITEAAKKALDSEGISIPYPQRDIHVHNVENTVK
ncbi:mechanosensitive ion channel [Porticoccaceae bacterium]|nr:mechanosensitive ion channel [Porticoccaceae bacterium]MDB4000995.1 mechanosensitive ion channel [bacterium]MDB4032446.1 mechanosensitive ion channel [Porticoccaceae bacterium]MDB4076540.1 mechanosensitive ion channel [Porticoccaceae bacterium]MDB4262721.1 mechanosensitive ion channel [Porticoccaceae bacterium]